METDSALHTVEERCLRLCWTQTTAAFDCNLTCTGPTQAGDHISEALTTPFSWKL